MATNFTVPEIVGDKPNQPAATTFKYPKRKYGDKKPTWRSFQPTWFQKWPWLTYDQGQDKVYCFTCVQAVKKEGGVLFKGKTDDAFLTRGYCNWKDAAGNKHGGFPTHERSQVKCHHSIMSVQA